MIGRFMPLVIEFLPRHKNESRHTLHFESLTRKKMWQDRLFNFVSSTSYLYSVTHNSSHAHRDTKIWKIRWKVKWSIAFNMLGWKDNLFSKSSRQKPSEVWNLKPRSKTCFSVVVLNNDYVYSMCWEVHISF